ncbi:hypothetical protein CMQ_8100 [Grosmannia clavigera kw1407]|uniref:Trafficking protein particle complex II-specific subunit 65 IgD3 domain-containing protein n=1 Tax=Grosmannia clavigera (strain kw1407 / UAMH 11150) TaxID=655863 RepID=F0XKV3_GROCL|nr:uncharacterized protein CMQ_8100 [Grosmannia clavigera kw1407]EFX01634.1 hypothetical protein CMQ_8100 [Grosmannia clavigera kw1407]
MTPSETQQVDGQTAERGEASRPEFASTAPAPVEPMKLQPPEEEEEPVVGMRGGRAVRIHMTAIQQTTDALPDQTYSTAGKAMAVPVRDEQDVSDAEAEDAAFLRESYLAFAVPLATDRRLEQALEQCHGSPQDLIEATEERESLFFGMDAMPDETVDVYFILRTRHEGAAHLQSFLDRLSITLDAHIVNIIPGRETPPPVEVIFNGSVEEVHRPLLVSRQPCGLNLLAALAGDPMLQLDSEGGWPRLSAQRVSRVAPAGLAQQQKANQRKWAGQPQPLRGQGATVLPIVPAVHARIRFVRPSTVPTSAAVVGVLELDFTPFFDCEAVLTRVEVTVRGGEVVDLNGEDDGNGDGKADEAGNADKAGQDGMRLPLFCVARDHLTFLYRLSPAAYGFDAALNTIPTLTPPTSRELDIAVEARVLVRPGMCEPSLAMAWTTAVDFSLPVNPGFGTALPPVSLQRGAHRPSQLSIDGMASMMAPAISRPDALPSLEAAARSTETTIPDFGITMTLTAPDRPVYAGEEFCWTVFIVNRTGGSALPALPGRETNGLSHGYGHGSANVHSASGSASTNTPVPATPPRLRKLALLVLPRRRRNDRSSLVDGTDVVCLSADTRVGPLAPHACHVVELRFVALRAGAVGIEAVRVVDLGSQEHVD